MKTKEIRILTKNNGIVCIPVNDSTNVIELEKELIDKYGVFIQV